MPDDPTTGDNGTVPPPAESDPLDGVDPHVRELLDRANGEAKQRRLHERQLEEELARRDRERETEQERIIREAKQEAIAEKDAEIDALKKEHLREQVKSRLIAAAAGKLRDPNDAAAYIDPAQIVDEDDDAKRETLITERIAKLVKDKPYLAAETSGPRPPLVAQGARTGQSSARPQGHRWLRGGS